jgi:hypothetical protein
MTEQADITETQQRAAERIVSEALPSELSISELLKNTDAAEDRDHAYIMAYLINLYTETMKRLQGRSMWKASDGQRLARLMNLLMELNAEKPEVPGKPSR